MLRFIVFAALLAASPAPAQEPANPTVVIDTGQRTWRIPYLYPSIRPPPGPLPTAARVPGFSFAFWMPDGRPSAVAGHESPSLRPREPGRPPPGPDDYLVIGTNVRAWDAPGARVHPARQLDNVLSSGSHRYEYGGRWGMLEVRARPGVPGNFDRYFGTRSITEPAILRTSVLASCPRPGVPGNDEHTINRICTGTVAISGLDVVFHVQVPQERMDGLMDATEVAARLLLGWADPNTIRR